MEHIYTDDQNGTSWRAIKCGKNLLWSETSQLALGKVAGILAIIPHLIAQHFGSHMMNRLWREERKRLRNSNRGDPNGLLKVKILHSMNLRWRGEGKMLLWIEDGATSFG